MSKNEVECIANYHCDCGENPLWNEREQKFYWCDIEPGRIFVYDPSTGEHHKIHDSGIATGGFTFQDNGSLLLFRVNDIVSLSDGATTIRIDTIDDDNMARFNDVISDSAGRVFAGTIGVDAERGGLYKVDHDGTIKLLFQGTGCSNGMGFTSDMQKMYWICSTTRRLFQFSYDAATGALTEREVLKEFPPEVGIPDGMTVDAEDCLWIAHYGGSSVCRYTPTGKIITKIDMPIAAPTSVIFGGPEMKDLYVTSAGGGEDKNTEDGGTFRIRTDTQGRSEFRSKVLT